MWFELLDLPDPVRYAPRESTRAIRFEMRLKAVQTGGRMTVNANGISIEGADEAFLYLSAGTTFRGPFELPGNGFDDCERKNREILESLTAESCAPLKAAHIEDYTRYFDRVVLSLSNTERQSALPEPPTDERIETLGSSDPGLVELLFQYGRYLMISGSRPGTMPLNLQGIWNDSVRPPWSSNYTLNINAEMNYWPAETCNLSELHSPLLDFIEDLALSGAKTARDYYGAEGWVHTTTPISGDIPLRSVISVKATRSGRSGRWAVSGCALISGNTGCSAVTWIS